MQFWNFIESENGGRELRLNGAISDETWFGDEVTPEQFRSELNAGTGDISVWINSPGGDVFAASQIYNMLRAYRGKVTVRIDSLAASAASIVAMAGDEVQISPVGQIMIHNPQMFTGGDSEELRTGARALDEIKESIINAYQLKTKLPRKQLAQLMNDETWLNACRAIELGFADKIIGDDSGTLTASQYSPRTVTNSIVQALKKESEPNMGGKIVYTWGNNHIEEKRGIVGDEYKKNFMNAIKTNFKNNYLRGGSLPDGGYLLPVEWHDEIISALSQANILREIGRVIQTASEHKISIVATKPQAAWVAEGQEISFTKETFNQISLNAYKIAIAIKISTELLQDSYYDIESHLTQEFSTAIGAAEEEAMLLGDGNNMPKGLIPTLTQSASGTLQTTGAEISADDLLTLQFSLRRPYRKSAVWLTSDAGLAMIRRLKDTTGNFIWQPSLTETEPSKLFGQAIYTSEFMPAPIAGNVAVLYGDFKDYFLIGERGQMEMQPLRELFAMSGQVAYLMTSRVDSVLSNPEAIRGLKIRA